LRSARVSFELRALARLRPYELALRFVLGGLVTVATGLIVDYAGPVIGGLFLAFPSILPASLTLIERHELERQGSRGADARLRARQAAGRDAAGACMGGLGLACFGVIVWRELPPHGPGRVLPLAALGWLACAVLLWLLSRIWPRARRPGADGS
jgi:Protein of unknown function (DUF3147)